MKHKALTFIKETFGTEEFWIFWFYAWFGMIAANAVRLFADGRWVWGLIDLALAGLFMTLGGRAVDRHVKEQTVARTKTLNSIVAALLKSRNSGLFRLAETRDKTVK